MPWTDSARTIPFSRIAVVSSVPPEGGVYGILTGDCCLMVGENWNLRARLLDLINNLSNLDEVSVVYELCPEHDRESRAAALEREFTRLQPSSAPEAIYSSSGITFRMTPYTETPEI